VAAPIPDAAAVTTATLPLKRMATFPRDHLHGPRDGAGLALFAIFI